MTAPFQLEMRDMMQAQDQEMAEMRRSLAVQPVKETKKSYAITPARVSC